MLQNRSIKAILLVTAIAAVIYLAISLFLPSPRRLIFGIDRQTGEIRLAESGVTFLPPHNYRRISFAKRDGAAQSGGIAQTQSRENIPIKVAYRIRFLIGSSQLPDARRIVIDGWDTWFNARVGEAVRAFTAKIPVEQLIAPTSQYGETRELLRQSVVTYLGQSGIEVTAFQIENLTVDRDALLAHKRQELRRRARAPVGRVAMFGIDGADWDLLDSLVRAGRMPNLASILLGGAKGEVKSIQPLVTPLVWASLSTGLPPSRHGIVDFFEPPGQRNPVTSRSRHTPALWEIASAFGRPTVVDDWWTAWPPRREDAIVAVPGSVRGVEPAVASELVGLAVAPSTIGHPQISRFAEISASRLEQAMASEEEQEPLVILRDVLSRTWTDHRVGLELYQKQQPMLFMLGFPGADAIHHVFGPFHPPSRGSVDYVLRARYWPVVINYYIELDRLLGEWVQILPEDTTLLIVSAHGHRWGRDRPTTLPFERTDLSSHRDRGVFIAFGNRVDPSRNMRPIDILDIAPTVLTLLGLPVAGEMPGELASGFFVDVHPVVSVEIASYSDVVTLERRGPADAIVDSGTYRAMLGQVGHLGAGSDEAPQAPQPPPAGGENWGRYAWLNNEGARLVKEGNLDAAVEAFEGAIALNDSRPAPYLNLAMIALQRQRFSSAEALTWKAIDLHAAEPESLILDLAAWYRKNDMPSRAIALLQNARARFPDSYAVLSDLGSALAAAERYTDAVPVLETALGLRPTSTKVLNNLGAIYADRGEYGRALDYWNRSLEITPRQPKIAEAVRAAISRL